MEEVYKFLKACGTYYLATMDADQPRVRPFGTIDIYHGPVSYTHLTLPTTSRV